ncbi:MAG: preprotein translocase subunit SecE [Planctomycetota bacterium]
MVPYRYKPDQGVFARGTAFWLATALMFYGARSLWQFLSWGWAIRSFGDVPILHVALTPGLLIAVLVFVIAMVLIWRLLNNPKLGDQLIETEAELRRVTWPSWSDTLTSSVVVFATVLIFVVYFAGLDLMLQSIFAWIFRTGSGLAG